MVLRCAHIRGSRHQGQCDKASRAICSMVGGWVASGDILWGFIAKLGFVAVGMMLRLGMDDVRL